MQKIQEEQLISKKNIPEFVIKLHLILQKPEFSDYICWNGDSEIVVKNCKKLQEKVLPNYFRHRKTSSFVRQLNMYKFSKVAKLTKEKNYVYFKNEHFKRGQFEDMERIKRHVRVKNAEDSKKQGSRDEQSQIDDEKVGLAKRQIHEKLVQMNKIISEILMVYPQLSRHLNQTTKICQNYLELLGPQAKQQYANLENEVKFAPQPSFGFITFNQPPSQVEKLYESKKNFNPIRIESLPIFPSYCSIQNGF